MVTGILMAAGFVYISLQLDVRSERRASLSLSSFSYFKTSKN